MSVSVSVSVSVRASNSPDFISCFSVLTLTLPLIRDNEMHAARRLGEEHGRLAGGISAADHDDIFAVTQLRLDKGGSVITPAPSNFERL